MGEVDLSTLGAERHITFARSGEGNTLTLDGIRALAAAIREAGRDPQLKLIRLRATGNVFCGGRAASPPPSNPPTAQQFRRAVADPILDVYRAMHESEIPVLAEVQGDAIGFGCALVAASDLAIASHAARFSFPEMAKNLPPTLVLSVLRLKIPPKAALQMVYLGETVDAETAQGWGLVAELTAPTDLAARADAMAASICGRDRIAVATLKTYTREILTTDFSLASETAGSSLAIAMTSIGR